MVPLLGADGSTDIFSVKLGQSGKSIKDVLFEMLPGAEVAAEKGKLGEVMKGVFALEKEGRLEEARELAMREVESFSDPDESKNASLNKRLEGETNIQMDMNGIEMFQRWQKGEDPWELTKEMVANPDLYSSADQARMQKRCRAGKSSVQAT